MVCVRIGRPAKDPPGRRKIDRNPLVGGVLLKFKPILSELILCCMALIFGDWTVASALVGSR